jgi:hypothetical protein
MVKQLGLCLLFLYSVEAAVVYTVSGFDSGGLMAQHMHIAFSNNVNGVGIVAAGPYYCSIGHQVRISTACTENGWLIELSQLDNQVQQAQSQGLINNISNILQDPVFIFSGSADIKVPQATARQTEAFYLQYVNPKYITTVYDVPANHAWISNDAGNPCWYNGPPFINYCGYDLAQDILLTLYGDTLNPKGVYNGSNMYSFEQANYANIWQAQLSTRGWIYIASRCLAAPNTCLVHVNFHGCGQSYDYIGNQYIKYTGFNEWAETNNLIILYPQVVAGTNNPFGCWDNWGYTNSNFSVQTGLQTAAVQNMALNYTKIVASLSN